MGGVSKGVEAMTEKKEITKENRIAKEVTKLKGVFKELDANKKKVVENLIKNAAFMAITLEDLQKTINEGEFSDTYQNGENQSGTKETPEVKIHLAMTKNYTAIIKLLTDLVPPAKKKESKLNKLREL